MRRLILIALFSLSLSLASAQTWEAGVFLGSSGYMGDINPIKPLKFTDLAFGAQIKRNFDGYWSAKLAFMQGKVQGNDANSTNFYQKQRNLSFYSPISELSLQVEFNLFKYLAGDIYGYGSRKVSPYLFLGVGAFSFNPLTEYNGNEIELIAVQTEALAYKNNAISVPYGAGVKYNITGNFNLIGEIGYRTAFTDYLDDISGRYPDFTAISPKSPISQQLSDRSVIPKIGIPGNQRGDFRPRDTYMFAGISLTYTFVPIKCPTF
jgi:opacity protein-like surface antigen